MSMFPLRILSTLPIRNVGLLRGGASKYIRNNGGVRFCCIKDEIFESLPGQVKRKPTKVTVVGVGSVGMACAYSIIAGNLCSHMCLIDFNEKKLSGEMQDIQHGSLYLHGMNITSSTKYEASKDSHLIVLAAGVRQKTGESRLNLTQRNVKMLKSTVPELVKYSPDAVFMCVSNPVDVMTYATWKLSGLPRNQVIGSGTNLDSSRFRVMIASRLGIAPNSCHGYIIGEHGDSSVAVWSGVNVSGITFQCIYPQFGEPDDPEGWHKIHKQVIDSAYKVIDLKGYTSWAIGMCVRGMTSAIFSNSGEIMPMSIMVQGFHGIKEECYMSLPVVLGLSGVREVVKIPLSDTELASLHKSEAVMLETQKELNL